MTVIVKCDWCGKEKRVRPSYAALSKHHFCNRKCYLEYRARKVTVKCASCGKDILLSQYYAALRKHHFCNRKCFNSRRVALKCDWCGKDILRSQSKLHKAAHHFCNKKCFGEYQTRKVTVKCASCGKDILIHHYRVAHYKRYFCNRKCQHSFKQGPQATQNLICSRCGKEFQRVKKTPLCSKCYTYYASIAYYLKYYRMKKYKCKICKKIFKRKATTFYYNFKSICKSCSSKITWKNNEKLTENLKEKLSAAENKIERLECELNIAKEWWDYHEKRSALKEETIQRLTFVLERASEHDLKHKPRINGK